MHFVYIVEFTKRAKNKIYPCYYIGSKSNGEVINNTIFDRHNKEYKGSSSSELYQSIFDIEERNISILFETDNYTACLEKEREFHVLYDVVADIRFFNRSIATISTYSNPEYATYKHKDYTFEFRRLPKNHQLVLDGTWVGTTKGRVIPEEERSKRGRSGELNSFYGKTHNKETIDANKERFQAWINKNPEYIERISKNASERFSGKPKSEQQRKKMSESSKGYVTLKNKITSECIRIKKESDEYKNLNLADWSTPYALRETKHIICDQCGKEGKHSAIFFRWHFKNCKYKRTENEHT